MYDSPKRRMLKHAKARAKRKGVPFSLRMRDVTVPEFCPVLGLPLAHATGHSCDTSPALDRIRPERGYVPGNILVVSDLANRIKANASPDQIQRVAAFYANLDFMG
jgi:hypothetical protein